MDTKKLNGKKEKITDDRFLSDGSKFSSNLQIAVRKFQQEECKDTDSVKSHENFRRQPTNKFQMTPAYFRSEQKKLEERYEILEVIGKGGYGEVKRIKDRKTNDIRALKCLHKNQCLDAKEFSEEIKILQGLVRK